MRRARWFAVVMCAALGVASLARAQGSSVEVVNGIGLIDYASHPRLKVGLWVRYHMTGRSVMGAEDDYVVTVLIAGEEDFWDGLI